MSGEPRPEEPTLAPAHLQAIYRQARDEFPRECCGYVLGQGEAAELVPCKNVQDQLHALDPETFPRTAENGYNIGGKELLRLTRSLDGEHPVRIVYHSHPRVGAYFSEEDTRAAIAADWPVDYLVVDVQEHEVVEAVLFRRAGDRYERIARFEGAAV
ncbi:Mov34/MPN/PAD-1 family protein [Paraliomyxa miuraensis]|uniref:Mov34/MPN/PAD-1 family protein n=1 Tax=Paraliomyxa miuraensis TaxID=376150 RepID=UPI00225BC90E|nr:Mov34/MPN/PAD-1 family protein [Paraliomyxa miuraensis]MCX4245692.1 Mov34/MPN/PAD-1 family protein [Paraliomyxa miuraensis]